MAGTPHFVLLTAADAGMLPGLEPVMAEVKLSQVSDEESLKARLPEADILLITDFRTETLRRAWPRRHHISWVHATSAGVNTLMFPELVDSDIQLTNARGVFDRGIAEYVLGAVLLFAKDSKNNFRYQQQHEDGVDCGRRFHRTGGGGAVAGGRHARHRHRPACAGR